MSWQILITISIISLSLSFIAQKKIASKDKIDPIALTIAFQLFAGLMIGMVALLNGISIPNLQPLIINLILMMILFSSSNIMKFTALKEMEASKFTILFPISAIASIFTATVFLGENFTLMQGLGFMFIALSVYLVSKKQGRIISFNKEEVLAIVSLIFLGLAFVNNAYILQSFDVLTFASLSFLLPATALSAFYPKRLKRIPALLKKPNLAPLFLSSFFCGIAVITLFYAYWVGRNAAQLSSLNQLQIIVTVILSIIILKETDRIPVKILAATISMAGAILLVM